MAGRSDMVRDNLNQQYIMKNKLIFIALVLMAASCSKESADTTRMDEITFTAKGFNAGISTKATEVTSLSSFNVHAVTGSMGSSETSQFNSVFTGTSSYTGGIFWPNTNPSYKFYASNLAMTPSASGPTVAATNATDVVCAVLANPAYKSSNVLGFNHIFARIGSCNITAPSGYAVSNLTVKITPKTGGTYNLFKGNGKTDGTGWSSTTDGAATTIASATGSTTDNGLYLVPGTYTLTASYTLTKGAYAENFTKTASVSIVGGKVNNISATLPAGNASEITFTVTITAWGTNNISISSWS